jgi:hypothetical protein
VSVFNSSGTLLGTASASTYQGTATVSLTGLVAGQTYYLLAAGATTDVFGMGAYKLTAQFGGFTPPPPPAPDRFEVNDTVATATRFGTVSSLSQAGLTLHTSTDVDYFTFTAATKGTFTVSITPSQGGGNLSLAVLNAQQTALASGQSSTGGVTLSLSMATGQQYYLKVSSPTGSLFTYGLSMAKAGAGGGGGGGKHLVWPGVGFLDAQPEGDVFYQNATDDPDYSAPVPHGPVSSPAPPQTSDPALATLVKVSAQPPAATPAFRDGAESLRTLAELLLALGRPASGVLSAATVVPAAFAAGPNQDSSSVVASRLPPPPLPGGSSGSAALAGDQEADALLEGRPAPEADLPVTPFARSAGAEVGLRLLPPAGDPCLADGAWRADPPGPSAPAPGMAAEDSAPASDAVLAAALVVVGGGYTAARRPGRRHLLPARRESPSGSGR